MNRRRSGRIVVLHLAARFPFAGVIWQLLHHLLGLRALGLEVYYIEDHRAHCYDPIAQTTTPDPTGNLRTLASAMERFGFGDRWAFLDSAREEYLGMPRQRCLDLLREADGVINLCGATNPRDEHRAARCLVYLETDPGPFQVQLANQQPFALDIAAVHRLFFTYALNLGGRECTLPASGVDWRPTRPPVHLELWHPQPGTAEPAKFTTVGTWHNRGKDVEINGETYYWSKHLNFRKLASVARLADQAIELATDLAEGPDHDALVSGGYSVVSALPMSLDIDSYHAYVTSSRGEFTASKDIYVRTRSGWFSDRSVCYLAAGRPVITERTGFEQLIPTGEGLLGFTTAEQAVESIRRVNSNYRHHARAARALAEDYFAANKVLDPIAEAIGT